MRSSTNLKDSATRSMIFGPVFLALAEKDKRLDSSYSRAQERCNSSLSLSFLEDPLHEADLLIFQ